MSRRCATPGGTAPALLIAVLLAMHYMCYCGSATATVARPHIVMVLADDLGWHDVSWTGSGIAKTPNLQRLADGGLILENAYALPSCSPSRAALLTARHPHTIGRQAGVIRPLEPTGLTLNVSTLADVLKLQGYSTHALGKWHLGFCDWKYTPTYRGFDTFQGFHVGAQNYYKHSRDPGKQVEQGMSQQAEKGYDYWNNTRLDQSARGKYTSSLMLSHLGDLLRNRNPRKPMFLYLPLQLVHGPLQVPARYTKLYPQVKDLRRKKQLGMVSVLDEMMGQVVHLLNVTGHYNNSVIGFTSDNGAALQSSGYSWPLRGRKGTLWEGGTRVPTFIHSPLLNRTGYRLKNLFHMVDWFPTFVSLAGGTPPTDVDGVDQWGALQGYKPPARHQLIYVLRNHSVLSGAIRNNRYKLLLGPHDSYEWHVPPELQGTDLRLELPVSHLYQSQLHPNSANSTRTVVGATSISHVAARDSSMYPHDDNHNSMAVLNGVEGKERVTNVTADDLMKNAEIYLFDLIADPNERSNLRHSHPAVVRTLLQQLLQELPRVVQPDSPSNDLAGLPSKHGGVWRPGWCTAHRK